MRLGFPTILVVSIISVACDNYTTSDINDEVNVGLNQSFSTEMLHLDNLETFDSLSASFMNTNYEFIKYWALKNGFKSLRQVNEEVVDDQMVSGWGKWLGF